MTPRPLLPRKHFTTKIKVFSGADYDWVNDFIKDKNVIDIKFNTTTTIHLGNIVNNFMVIYEEEE